MVEKCIIQIFEFTKGNAEIWSTPDNESGVNVISSDKKDKIDQRNPWTYNVEINHNKIETNKAPELKTGEN